MLRTQHALFERHKLSKDVASPDGLASLTSPAGETMEHRYMDPCGSEPDDSDAKTQEWLISSAGLEYLDVC